MMRKLTVLILICMLAIIGCERTEKGTHTDKESTWMTDGEFAAMMASLKKSIAENRYETLKFQQALATWLKPIQVAQSYTPPAYKLGTDVYRLVDQWQAVPNGAIRNGNVVHIGNAIEAKLIIDVALTSAYVPHTGTEIQLWVTLSPGETDEFTKWMSFIGPVGTPAVTRLVRQVDEGARLLVTTGLGDSWANRYENVIFILDDEVENSEMALRMGLAGNLIWVGDGTFYAHDENDWVYSIADSYVIDVPVSFHKIKVVINNGYDKDGSRVHTRTRVVVRDPETQESFIRKQNESFNSSRHVTWFLRV